MNEEDTVTIQLSKDLVKRAEDEGLNVSRSCELALQRRVGTLESIDFNNSNGNFESTSEELVP